MSFEIEEVIRSRNAFREIALRRCPKVAAGPAGDEIRNSFLRLESRIEVIVPGKKDMCMSANQGVLQRVAVARVHPVSART